MLLALCLALTGLHACSLLVETRDQQGSVDGDCASFPGARCDVARHVCAPPGTTASGSGGGSGSSSSATTSGSSSASTSTGGCEANGCYSCPPTTNDQFLNACSDGGCKPFSNTARLKNLTSDGGVPPLPKPDGG
jgi:hypothetical protein